MTASQALYELRSVIPEGITRSSKAQLLEQGVSTHLLERLWNKRILWLVRMEPGLILNIHAAELE